jgi:hypothetical protein
MPDCTVAAPRYATDAAFTAWKQTVSTSLSGISTNSPVPDATRTSLSTLEKDVLETLACLQGATSTAMQAHTTNAELTTQINSLKTSIANAKGDTQVAEDRVKYIRAPQERTSYYESWFPLHRPMKAEAVPAFLAVTLFFGLMAFFLLLSMMGIQLTFMLPPPSSTPSAFGLLWARLTWPFWVATVVIIGLSIYIYKLRAK